MLTALNQTEVCYSKSIRLIQWYLLHDAPRSQYLPQTLFGSRSLSDVQLPLGQSSLEK